MKQPKKPKQTKDKFTEIMKMISPDDEHIDHKLVLNIIYAVSFLTYHHEKPGSIESFKKCLINTIDLCIQEESNKGE